MRRLLVIGSPGSGKSTLARQLATATGLPLIHLDAEYHLPGWIARDEFEWRARLAQLVTEKHWIIDGNYGGSMDFRLRYADTAILLDYPSWLCLWRVVKRIATLRGTVRPDAAPGCAERLDWSFLAYVLAFRSAKTPALERRLSKFDGTVIRFRHPAEAEAFLASFA